MNKENVVHLFIEEMKKVKEDVFLGRVLLYWIEILSKKNSWTNFYLHWHKLFSNSQSISALRPISIFLWLFTFKWFYVVNYSVVKCSVKANSSKWICKLQFMSTINDRIKLLYKNGYLN